MHFKITFNRALIISFLWHALCFFSVTVIIVPSGIMRKRLSDIYFLGSLLDRKSLSRAFKNIDAFTKNEHKYLAMPAFKTRLDSPPARMNTGKAVSIFPERLSESSGIDVIIKAQKLSPDISKKESSFTAFSAASDAASGGKKERLVVFKPPLPDYETAVSIRRENNAPVSCKVSLRLVIAPDGTVKTADTLQTSGYPEIDLIAQRYAKKWKFIPLQPNQPQKDEERITNIEFSGKSLSKK